MGLGRNEILKILRIVSMQNDNDTRGGGIETITCIKIKGYLKWSCF